MQVPARIACAMLLMATLFAQQAPPTPAQSPAFQQPAPSPAQRGFQIAGVLVNSLTGQPVPGATVAISRVAQGSDRDITKSVTTAADGRFSFTQLSRGKYSLMATARGASLQYFDHHDPYATAIAVGPDLDSEHLVFRLEPDAAIDGDVTDDNNEPIQYATVRLFQTTTEDGQQKTLPENQTQTDDLGHYHLGHLEPGTYYLVVSARPWYAQNARAPKSTDSEAEARSAQDAASLDVTYPLTFYSGATDSADATPMPLTPGERATADVTLHATPSLHLRIHTGSTAESPVIGRMIFPRVSERIFQGYLDSVANAPDSWVAPGVIEISGLSPGRYVVEIPASTGLGEKSAARGGWYREIDLTGDTDITAAEGPGFVSVGGVLRFEGVPRVPREVSIQLLNPETGETFRSDLNERGEFDFNSDNVRPGRYLIALENANGYSLDRLAATGAKITGRTLEIGGAASVRISGIASHGAAQVNGTALRDGQPVSGAMIVLVPQDPTNNFPLFRRDQSDSDGTFTLANVVPGQYTVLAIANGWDLEWSNPTALQPYMKNAETVQVPAGGKLDVKVQVQ